MNSEPFQAEETLTAGTSSVVRERGSKRQPNVSTRHIRGLHNHCGLAYHAAAEAISGGSCDAASGVSVALVPWAEEAACASSARATRANGAADRRGRPEPAATAAAPSAPGALAAPKPARVFAASPGLSAEEARAKADREGGFPAQGIPRPTLAFPLPLPFPAFQRSPAFPFPFAHLRSPETLTPDPYDYMALNVYANKFKLNDEFVEMAGLAPSRGKARGRGKSSGGGGGGGGNFRGPFRLPSVDIFAKVHGATG